MNDNPYRSWNHAHRIITLAALTGALIGLMISWSNGYSLGFVLVESVGVGIVCAVLARWVLRQAMRIWLENRLAAAEVEIKAKEKKIAEEMALKKKTEEAAAKVATPPAKKPGDIAAKVITTSPPAK